MRVDEWRDAGTIRSYTIPFASTKFVILNTQNATCLLDELDDAQEATVLAVQSVNGSMPPEMLRRLSEIGFLPGERVRIIGRGMFGGTPLAVRVGTSTFALRRAEARCVQVTPIAQGPHA